jgi:hypothetical protein
VRATCGVLLGETIGLARPTNIRTLIEGNRAELETFGAVHSVRALVRRPQGGTVYADSFYLNEEQALLVVSLSRTEAGRKLRAELIRALRHGAAASWGRPYRTSGTPPMRPPERGALGSGAERPRSLYEGHRRPSRPISPST